MEINLICKEILNSVEAALGCAVVDLRSGVVLGISHKIPYFTHSIIDRAAAAAMDMFRGNTVQSVEQMINDMRCTQEVHLIEEIQITTKNTYHFMAIVPERPNIILILTTNKKVNLGMGWSKVRVALPLIAPLCPLPKTPEL